MKQLWSCSTTMRNPERTYGFLSTIAEMEGIEWTKKSQEELQIRLIKNRLYTPKNIDVLSKSLQKKFHDLTHTLTLEEASKVFYAQNYESPDMRGRTSFDPIEKMGLAGIADNKIFITDMGQRFLDDEIEIGDVMLSYLLKFQYPNPFQKETKLFSEYNTKPFINVLRLIKYVNTLSKKANQKEKGISKLEFGIFALSITDYSEVENIANKLFDFRNKYSEIKETREKDFFVNQFIDEYLKDFTNPRDNIKEYRDNIIRCIRLTKYIYIRGGGYYIDLEPRRMTEINAILNDLTGAAEFYSKESYQSFIGDYYGYTMPFETVDNLQKIANQIITEIEDISRVLNKQESKEAVQTDIKSLNRQIQDLRNKRNLLQNELIKHEYNDNSKIDEAITSLKNIKKLEMKPSIALEKWVNISLNILDDATLIKPNFPLGDDNEPTYTAPAKVPDIECFYESFNSICEVTMLSGRDQWFNEGQPVMRHLREFENNNSCLPTYCLFIAPKIHQDTINTFWTSVKYEFEGKTQKIIPITITELIEILQIVKKAKERGIKIFHNEMQYFFDLCSDVKEIPNSTLWRDHISQKLNEWKEKYL